IAYIATLVVSRCRSGSVAGVLSARSLVRGPRTSGPSDTRFRNRYSSPSNWWSAFGLPGSSAWPPGPSLGPAVSEVGSAEGDSAVDSRSDPATSGAVWSPCWVVSAAADAAGGTAGVGLLAAPAGGGAPNASAPAAVR